MLTIFTREWTLQLTLVTGKRLCILQKTILAGEGGPTSLFRQAVGVNSWAGSKGIIPLESQDAFEWAQKHLGEEIVEAHFVDWIEDA